MTQGDQPGQSYWELVLPFWLPLNESWDRGAAAFLTALHSVPAKARHLYAAHWCNSEVLNGGLFQFFYKTTGILAPEAVAGFDAVGAAEIAAVVADAMAYFGPVYPRDRYSRLSILPQFEGSSWRAVDPFKAHDSSFYAWLDAVPNRWELLADAYATSA